MKIRIVTLIALAACALSCKSPQTETEQTAATDTAAAEKPPVTLTLKWETDTTLTTCESVLYDKDKDILYVSNIDGVPDRKDGNGFISKVSLDGKVTEARWAKGMDAPKGMGLANGKLYVTDIDRVHEIDVNSGKIVKSYKVDGAKFLNDITVDANGKVFISDSGGGAISVIENGKLSKWMENMQGPNGLLAEGSQMLVALWDAKNLNTLDYTGKQLTLRVDGIENPDGIEAIGEGAYFVSSWNGMIHYIGPDWKKTLILDTRADSLNAADIEYIPGKKLLLVPAFFKNKVMAYEVTQN